MINNLFIVNSTYHLILAIGITKAKCYEDRNDLLIYDYFSHENINFDELKEIFEEIIIIKAKQGSERKKVGTINKIKEQIVYFSDIRKKIKNKNYTNVFVNNDIRIENQCILSFCKSQFSSKIISIEDGTAAYSDLIIPQMDFKNRVKFHLMSPIRYILYGFNYEILKLCGTYSKIDERMFLWPDLIRDELKDGKKINGISSDCFKEGISFPYAKMNILLQGDIRTLTLFIDHEETFSMYKKGDVELYKTVVKEFLQKAEQENISVFAKYHPRDNSGFLDEILHFYKVNIIDKDIPAEILIKKNNNKIVSGCSTILLTAAKVKNLNEFISLIDISKIEYELLKFQFNKIGISMPKDINSLTKVVC